MASPSPDESSQTQQVLICQHKSCQRAKAAAVLAAFRAHPVPSWEIVATSCLGQCGNGPMVVVLPDQVWYARVHPDEVPAVVDRHLKGGVPIRAMLYHKPSP